MSTSSVTENLVIEGVLNGLQLGLGVKSNQVEHRDTSGGEIECYGEEVVNPCNLVLINGAAAGEKQP